MCETTLDVIGENFSLSNYSDINTRIRFIQDKYIMSRIKRFWRLPLIVRFTVTKIIAVFSTPEVCIIGIEDEEFQVSYSQRAMVMGQSEFWANLLLKRRCPKVNLLIAGQKYFLRHGRRK